VLPGMSPLPSPSRRNAALWPCALLEACISLGTPAALPKVPGAPRGSHTAQRYLLRLRHTGGRHGGHTGDMVDSGISPRALCHAGPYPGVLGRGGVRVGAAVLYSGRHGQRSIGAEVHHFLAPQAWDLVSEHLK